MTTFLPGCRSTSGNRLNHDGVAVEFTGKLRLDKAAFMPQAYRTPGCPYCIDRLIANVSWLTPEGMPGHPRLLGWGARIRTWEWRNQNPLPYHLATPHRSARVAS